MTQGYHNISVAIGIYRAKRCHTNWLKKSITLLWRSIFMYMNWKKNYSEPKSMNDTRWAPTGRGRLHCSRKKDPSLIQSSRWVGKQVGDKGSEHVRAAYDEDCANSLTPTSKSARQSPSMSVNPEMEGTPASANRCQSIESWNLSCNIASFVILHASSWEIKRS